MPVVPNLPNHFTLFVNLSRPGEFCYDDTVPGRKKLCRFPADKGARPLFAGKGTQTGRRRKHRMNRITITDFAAPELDVYARLNEAQLLHYYEPAPGLFIAESPKVITRAADAGHMPESFLAAPEMLCKTEAAALLARFPDTPVYTAAPEILTRLTGFQLTRGMLCAMRRRELPSAEKICENARTVAVLENVVNPTNVGAIFRSAAALNLDAVLLTEGCSDPYYRRAARVSMGTVFQIPWTYIRERPGAGAGEDSSAGTGNSVQRNPAAGNSVEQLQTLGFRTAAMALEERSVRIDDPAVLQEPRLAVFLGTEGDGLAARTIASCDYTIMIPMSHGVDSLNVAAASAVAFWQLGSRPGIRKEESE